MRLSIDRAYKVVTGKKPVEIQIFYTEIRMKIPCPSESHREGEMPTVGEWALARIRELQTARGVTLDRVLYNHTPIEIERLERFVLEFGGTVPVPAPPVRDAPAVVIPPEVLAIGPYNQVHIAAWYQHEGMEKPDRHFCFQPISIGLEFVYHYVRWLEEEHPEVVFPKFKIDKYEVSREAFEALRPWGRMEEEKEHTVTVYYTVNRVPFVKFFDGVPIEAAARALSWLETFDRVAGVGDTTGIRRIHFVADSTGSNMDIAREGLARLATPAPEPDPDDGPISTGSPGVCCPENRLGRDGHCTGCGTALLPELQARYLHLLRDEIASTLEFDKLPHDGVLIVNVGGGYVVLVAPRAGDLPTALAEHLTSEATE